jgi:hypothetical protein
VPIAASIQIAAQELTADRRAEMASLRAAATADVTPIGALDR